MFYQIEKFKLFPNENKLSTPDGDISIRPKTLQLLILLIDEKEQVHNKQGLLDAVWDSAGAQDYLLFQSINEIRNLFKPLIVIKTFPRKGYQWVHDVEKLTRKATGESSANTREDVVCSPTAQTLKNQQRSTKKITSVLAFVLVLIAIGYSVFIFSTPEEKFVEQNRFEEKSRSRELVVLPINNMINDAQHRWVRLGAMDVVIQKLKSHRKFAVLDVEDIMMALARGKGFGLEDFEQQSRILRSQLGEIVTLHSKLIGGPMEYQLHYSLIGRYYIKQGIVFAGKLDELWDKLLLEVMQHYQTPYGENSSGIAQQVADYQFLQAMEQFHRGEFHLASQFFLVLLNSQPQNVTARRYLLKSLIWSKQFQQAEQVGAQALQFSSKNNNPREHLRLLFALGVLASQQQQFVKANELFEQSRVLAEQHFDNLYAAYAHSEIGHILVKQKQWQQAEFMYQQALSYHKGFNCPYGQINNLDALSKIAFAQRDMTMATMYFDNAMTIANKNELLFEQISLLLNKASRIEVVEQKDKLIADSEALIKQIDNNQIKQQFNAKIFSLKNTVSKT